VTAENSPLITVDQLTGLLDDPQLRLADTRWYLGDPGAGGAAYSKGHLRGAIHIDLDRHLSAASGPGRHPLPTRKAFASTLGSLGIGHRHLVVAYDDRGGVVAARLWWMLRNVGHQSVRVLDGGLRAWIEAGELLTKVVPDPEPVRFPVHRSITRTVDRQSVARTLGEAILVDARAPERYRGELEPVDPVAGHIPTALNLDCEGNLDTEARLLPPADLEARYRAAGIDGRRDTVVYCGSGVTACHDILAMRVAGLPEAALYPGSWSDWCTAGLPIATGPEPGGL
jgi:thiosulfate/3-mercaptopyruvate sulfurtransferase